MLDVKEWIAKVTKAIDTPCVEVVNFNIPITSKASGNKTASFTITVPSGYEVIPWCRVIGLYVSGNASVIVTDRNGVNPNGSTVSFSYYLWNPNNITGALSLCGSILCRRVGGVVRKLLKALKPLTLERGWAVC